jgi:outer membrane protein TolC
MFAAVLAALPALNGEPLSLKDAVRQALAHHPSLEAAAADIRAAQSRVEQARTGYLPRASVSEYYQTANQPVFAFGTLLNQRRFVESNFAIDSLNHPGFVNNFQTQAGFQQTVWDFGATRAAVRSAEIGRQLSEEERKRRTQQRIALTAQAYHAVTLAAEGVRVSEAAVASAEAGLQRAEAVRDAGLSTDADVLAMRVHLAAMREQLIRRKSEHAVARAALNEAMGASLDSAADLSTPLTPAPAAEPVAAARPELRLSQLMRESAAAQRAVARQGYYPRIVARGVFEANAARFVTRGGTNFFLGAGMEWNAFDPAVRRRVEEASHAEASAAARERETAAQLLLERKRAQAQFEAAQERVRVSEAAGAEAEESLRIVKNRYEAGLARVDEVLRAETALLEARMRRLAAVYEQRMGAVAVELAAGALREDSDVLN